MKQVSTIFLQAVLVLIGIGVLVFMLWEPHLEGRNVNATLFAIYFKDPFLAYVYIGSIPFFVGLYHGFKVLGYVGQNQVFSLAAVKALQTIKYCAFITAGAIVGADAWLLLLMRGEEDAAGVIMLSLVATFASVVIGTAAAVLERVLQGAVDTHSEHELAA